MVTSVFNDQAYSIHKMDRILPTMIRMTQTLETY